MRIHPLWLLPAFVLLFSACQKNDEEANAGQAKISKPLQNSLQHSTSKPTITPATHKPILRQSRAASLGITVEDDKIIIDTKQTKDFFRGIGEKMKHSFQKLEDNLQKERISSPDETGIIVNDTTIQIDLNKTERFMKKWMRSMESVVEELNETMEEIQRSLPQR